MKCLYTPEAKPTTKLTTTTTTIKATTKAIKLLVINFHQRLRKGWKRDEKRQKKVYSSSSFSIIHYKYVLFTIWQVG
jgi:hypothetical protein